MTVITEAYVDSLAPNAGAMKNGRDLAKKNSFPSLNETVDGTVLFGACSGSGKDPYQCSVDFVQEGSPVFRCTCPSRQFPCKHGLGLLYAKALGKPFAIADLPQDIADKREKAEKREEKKKETAAAEAGNDETKPKRKVNKSALVKKIGAQLEGLAILEKQVLQLVQAGLGSMDKKTVQLVEEQAKQLGNYYIPGAQAGLRELALTMKSDADRESVYSVAMERLIALLALANKGRSYLEQRAAQPELPMDADSTLEELLGHAWQLGELREYGRVQKSAELLQLAFYSYADEARGEFVDAGWWADLNDGTIRVTRHLRPFRVAKSLREDDTVLGVLQAAELFVYPGEVNARVRWEKAVHREAGAQDYERVKSQAAASFTDTIKRVKNGIKNPLAEKQPVMLIAFQTIVRIGEAYALIDKQGRQLTLTDNAMAGKPTTPLIALLQRDDLTDQAALVMFRHDIDSNRLAVQLMSIVTDSRIIRLL